MLRVRGQEGAGGSVGDGFGSSVCPERPSRSGFPNGSPHLSSCVIARGAACLGVVHHWSCPWAGSAGGPMQGPAAEMDPLNLTRFVPAEESDV